MDTTVLALRNLSVRLKDGGALFGLGRRAVTALDDVTLNLQRGETVALLGESGAGKTTLARVATGELKPDRGQVLFEGEDLWRLRAQRRATVLRRLQYLSQDPREAWDRERGVGRLLGEELLRRKLAGGNADARDRVAAAFARAELPPGLIDRKLHELSGGELQRAAIARIIALNPRVVALDEPLSGVDPQLRGRLLDLLVRLQQEQGYAYLLITHDLAQVRRLAGRVAVLYRGRLVEEGPARAVLADPQHPHTRALLLPDAVRSPDPEPFAEISGCSFHPLCPVAEAGRCDSEVPQLRSVTDGRSAACHIL